MHDIMIGGTVFVHAAALTYVLGFMTTDQRVLRLLILAGSLLYVAYYALATDRPLWDAMFWSALIAVVNLFVLTQLLRDRRHRLMSPDELDLLTTFPTLTPGDCRRLARSAIRRTSREPVVLTREGERPLMLYFVSKGSLEIEKGDRVKREAAVGFVGEISLMTGSVATATVTLRDGGSWLEWPRDALERSLRRRPLLREALERALKTDLARKVANA